jgi:NADH-quinone oxidoreductase subunit A
MGLQQMDQYAPVLILAVVAVGMIVGMMVLSVLLGKRGRRPPIKDSPYECGMLPIGSGTPRFAVKFYIVAMLFILFDIEVVFLYPWAVVYKEMLQTHAALAFGAMLSFTGVLFAGYVYALKKGALNWRE